MPDWSIEKILSESFPSSGKENWRQAASSEIEGKDPFDALKWKGKDDIYFLPYYDSQDVANLNYLGHLRLRPSQQTFLGPRAWINAPHVTVHDASKANKISLEHLANGADGIYFNLKVADHIEFEKLLHEIEWSYCSLYFEGRHSSFLHDILKYIHVQHVDTISGALFHETLPLHADIEVITRFSNLKALGIIIRPDSPVHEVSNALTSAVLYFESLKIGDHLAEKIFRSITFSINLDQNLIENIAKLKALRLLWYQVAQAYGFNRYKFHDLHLHVRSETWIAENFQPHGNMLKGTIAAMGGILGGCDALTVVAEDESKSMMTRTSRNISNILREESFLNKVADPTAGAYAIDVVTEAIAKQAWAIFQSNVKA